MRPSLAPHALLILLGLSAGCAVYPPAVFCQRDVDCEDPGKVCDLAIRRCVDPGDVKCEPRVSSACRDGALVWVDGCGEPGEVAVDCECGCSADDACDPCCTTNAECAYLGENHFCDPFTGLCDCAASCGGLCCGGDGCGGSCPEVCPPDARCDFDTCRCVASDDSCPAGQTCNQLDDTGLLGCTLPDGSWPPGTQFDCGQYGLCEGMGTFCQFLSGVTACVRECGTCPDDQICYDITGNGFFACLTPNYDIPYDAPTGCQAHQDCPGNRLCWCLDAECADTICLENCSPQP